MTFLLDTNHPIAHLNDDTRITAQVFSRRRSGDVFAISVTVLGELYFGAYTSQRTADNLVALQSFVSQVVVYEFDEQTADEFGRIKAEQRAKGNPIPTADAQIAAVGRLQRLTVLTDDAHFQTVNGLDIENWLT